MGTVYVCDLRHFLDLPDGAPGPARRMADRLALIVRAATAGDAGAPWVTAVPCDRRPRRQRCPGHVTVRRTDVPPSIAWSCTSCADEGVISGWEGTAYDLRRRRLVAVPADPLAIVVPTEAAAALRDLRLVEPDTERLILRAQAAEEGALLIGSGDEFEELLDAIAAEANHEPDRRRQRRLDGAFDAVSSAIASHAAG